MDKAVVRPLAERLRRDGTEASVYDRRTNQRRSQSAAPAAKIEEGLERSRVLVLCMSANAFGSDWAQLESGSFRFRDPLNEERRFFPLRLDDARFSSLEREPALQVATFPALCRQPRALHKLTQVHGISK